MATEKADKFKVNDRVKRLNSTSCYGTVKDTRYEVTATTGDAGQKGLLITVLWDNGTFSYFGPDGLEAVPNEKA
jgi:hypothetical protein